MGSTGSCLRLHRADTSACQSIQLEWKCWSIPFQYVTARTSAHSSTEGDHNVCHILMSSRRLKCQVTCQYRVTSHVKSRTCRKHTGIIYTMITSSYPIDHHSNTLSSLPICNLWFFCQLVWVRKFHRCRRHTRNVRHPRYDA